MLRFGQTDNHGSLGEIELDLDDFVHVDAPLKREVLPPHVQPSKVPLVVSIKAHAFVVLEGVLVVFLRFSENANRKVIFGSHLKVGFGCSFLRQRVLPINLIVILE